MAHVGSWRGTNALRMMPTDPFVQSEATAQVRTLAGGLATLIEYSYEHADGRQWGTLLLNVTDDRAHVVFLDTFHQSPGWLVLHGTATVDGFEVRANYAPGFDWIITVAWASDSLVLRMSNVMADVGSYVAVEMVFQR